MITRRLVLTALAACGASLIAACAAPPRAKPGGPVLLVIGATGGTGVEIVRRALARGYAVRALVRDEHKARQLLGDEVRYYLGDVRDPGTLAAPFRGAGLVISALGSNTKRDPANLPEFIDYGGVKALAEAAAAARVQHFVLVSSMGVTHPDHRMNALFDDLMVWKRRGEDALRASGVPYTIVRPGKLTNDAGGLAGLTLSQGDAPDAEGSISRSDLAAVCVAVLGRPKARGKTFEIVSAGAPAAIDWGSALGALRADSATID